MTDLAARYEDIAQKLGRSWKNTLISGERGPRACLANALTAMRSAPAWDGTLGFDEFRHAVMLLSPPPWIEPKPKSWQEREWTADDDTRAAEWMQRHGIGVASRVVAEAATSVARGNPSHPVRNYINGLTWDGTPRLAGWLSRYLGASGNATYLAAVGSKWLIAAVARVMRPGTKVDEALILEGPQGAGKSTALRILAGEWFADRISDLASKDSLIELSGVWVVELAELDALSKAETTKIKSFMSSQVDRYRPPYGTRLEHVPRQCVFAGSTNRDTYLRDETGGRRFWPVRTGTIDLDGLRRDRDQLWAEARDRFEKGGAWHLTAEEFSLAKVEQEARQEAGQWDEVIARFIVDEPIWQDGVRDWKPRRAAITEPQIDELLACAIGKSADRWTKADRNEVGASLRRLGFVNEAIWDRSKARTVKRWVRNTDR